jgi:predicted transcriptional regulator
MESIYEIVAWDHRLKSPEKMILIKLLSLHGLDSFHGKYEDMAEKLMIGKQTFSIAMPRLRALGWIQTEKMYEDNVGNFVKCIGMKFQITIPEEPKTS